MHHAHTSVSRCLAALLATVLALGVVVWAPPGASAQSDEVTVSATAEGDTRILAGEDGRFTVRATGGGDWGYNLAIVVRVPLGVEPVGSSAGLPRVTADPAAPTTHRLWIWEDVADLPAGGTYELVVTARPTQPPVGGGSTGAADVFPVGSTVSLTPSTYVSTDPTLLPAFPGTSAVDPDASAAVTVSDATTHAIDVAALRVTKTEPSPEAELVRGVHDHTTIYTVEVENTSEGVTAAAQLVDWIPAGLEYLGCGNVDNTTVDRAGDGSGHEYPGAGDLTGTPTVPPMGAYVGGTRDGCLQPVEVVTVANDPDAPTADVYTKVTWDLGDLPAGSTTLLRYRAAVPLYENTVDFDGVDGAPTGASLEQTANLDNNNGPSTRHSAGDGSPEDGTVWRNLAEAAGSYQGVVRTGTSRAVTDEDDEFIHAMDLAVLKSVDEDEFTAGATGTYRLELRTSEYTSASDIVLTDRIPNGLCPLLPTGIAATGDALPAGCEQSDGHPSITGALATAVHFDAASGQFTLTLEPQPAVLPASTDAHVITYPVHMRADYTEAGEYGPTTSLDDFVNHVEVVANTTSIPALADWFPDVEDVWDDSQAGLPSQPTQIAKRVAPRDAVTPDVADGVDPCPASGYLDDLATDFRAGDTACFELTVSFPAGISTRNPVVTDVLPTSLDLAGWAAADPASAALLEPDAFSTDGRRLEWLVGTEGAGGDRYVAPGAVLTLHLWTTVAAPAAGPAVDKPENLMKFRQENVQGEVFFLRDEAVIDVEPGISLTKGVADVDGEVSRPAESQASSDGSLFGSNRDGIVVREGEEVRYRVDLHPAAFPVADVEVWDSLPAAFTCADVSDLDPAGGCLDPSDPAFPTGLSGAHASRSVLVWTGLAVSAEPAAGTTLGYTVTVPTGTSVSTRHGNTASVISYTAGTNTSSDAAAQPYLPSNSLDTSLADDWNAPGERTRDDSAVLLPDAVVTKAAVTDIADAPGFNTGSQAVTGELITYTYGVVVPANTTVYDGVLTDILPSGLDQHGSPTASFDDGVGGPGALPAGFTLETNGTLRFPAAYDNQTAQDHRFEVVFQAFLADGHSRAHGANLVNTARFASNRTEGGTALPVRQATAAVQYVQPAPTITKRVAAIDGEPAATPPRPVAANELITYELQVTNAASRPTSHDTVVTDCVPDELIFEGYATPPAGVTTSPAEPGDGTNGCDEGTTRLAWDLGEVAASQTVTLAYDVTVSPAAGGQASYVNEAEVVGHTLPEGPPSGDRGTLDDDATATVEVIGAELVKSVDPGAATIGESVSYTVTATLPADVNFYDARIDDVVPAGIAVSAATCTPSDPSITCTGPNPASSDGTDSVTLEWQLGDVTADPDVREMTITYTGTVVATADSTAEDLDPVAGDQLVNVAALSWDTLPIGGERRETYDDATVTVLEPDVTITKLVDGGAHRDVEPGGGFTYTVEVANVGTSTAHDVTVTDEVPAGVVVDAATISDGGILSGADPVRGGGTITWAIDQLEVGGANAVTFTYAATLAPSPTLDTATLENVATVTEYASTESTNDDRRVYTGPSDDAAVTPAFPAVAVTKDVVDGGTTARVGDAFPWDLTITNTGDVTAYDVVVTDQLPYGWDAGSTLAVAVDGTAILPTPQADLGEADGRATLTWTFDELAPGAVATIRFASIPTTDAYDAPGAGVGSDNAHVNTVAVTADDATGSSTNGDGPYGGDPDDAEAFLEATNVAITKTRAAGEVRVGDEVTFTLTVVNTGDQPADDVVVTDTLPTGLTFADVDDPVVADGTVWDCSVVGDTVTCALLAPLPAGADASLTVTAGVLASAAPSVTNVAEVTTTTPQTDLDDDRDEALVPVIPVADLRLVKGIDGSTSVVAGERITWTIDVRNLGPSTSVAPITVVDTLPEGVSDVVVTAPGWSCGEVEDQVLTCTLGTDLPLDTDAPRIVIDALIDPEFEGTLTNQAVVSATTEDPDDGNDEDEVTTDDVDAIADLALTKSLVGDELAAGGIGRYRLAVSNAGPSDARNVTIADQLPAGLTYAGSVSSASGHEWTCADLGDGDVACELRSGAGTLAAGAATWLEFDVAVAASATGSVRNVATVSTTTEDPDDTNDSDDETTELAVRTNLSATKSHDGAVRRVGDQVTFALRVTNHGPADATAVTLVDTLPAGLTFDGVDTPVAAGADWDCDVDTDAGILSCALGRDLPADVDGAVEELEVTARVTPAAYPSATNTVEIATATDQTTLDDDTAEDAVAVAPLVDLEVVKTIDRDQLVVGGTGTYVVTVTNRGPTADPGPITLVDVLPVGLTHRSHSGAACTVDGRQVTCDLGALDVGGTAEVRIGVEVGAEAYPEVTNVAEVRTPSEDTDPSNDHDDVTTPVLPDVSFSLDKRRTSVDSDRVTWTITATNTGRNVAEHGFTIRDPLPDGLAFVSAAGDGFDCSYTGGEVRCVFAGPLAPGASASIILVTEVTAGPGTTITNVAYLDAGNGYPVEVAGAEDEAVHQVAARQQPPGTPPTGPAGSAGSSGSSGSSGPGGGRLPFTGAPGVLELVTLAGLLLAFGAALARRRREGT